MLQPWKTLPKPLLNEENLSESFEDMSGMVCTLLNPLVTESILKMAQELSYFMER